MAQMSKWMVLMRTILASALAITVATPNEADAQSQSDAAKAYRAATQQGTVRALERFISQYPLSREANNAFRDIVTLSRGSSMSGSGPSGLFTGAAPSATTRSFGDPY